MWQQLVEATPWGHCPKYLVRDRKAVYGRNFVARAREWGIQTLLTPFCAPKANAIAERVIRTLRRECLDHALIVNEEHLQAVLQEYVGYYDTERPHRSLTLMPPRPSARTSHVPGAPPGHVVVRPILGGLHHVYERTA